MIQDIALACSLTERQRTVLSLIADGFCTKEIARQMKLSEKTVEFHRMALMRRAKTNSIARLTKLAVRLGLSKL